MNRPAAVKRIYLVFKTHLDLGYTALASEIFASYRDRLIPESLAVADALRARGGTERFSWTMGSWIVHECLEAGAPELRASMEAGIRKGDIHWLGVPFTTHTELMDPSLYRFGLSISRKLDERFGRTTIAAKLTDVPGHTRSMVPLLAEAGIRFLHIGCNPGSACPVVPDLFRWAAPDGSEVLVMYHKKEYGEIMVPPGLNFGIACAHTSDNVGPQKLDKILAIYADLRQRFPNAEIEATSLDAFATALLPHAEQFPVVTREIGDTWIHGPGSAPNRLARYRTLSRLRRQWIADGSFDDEKPTHYGFSNNLLCIAEHTWGLGRGQLMEDSCYTKIDLGRLRRTEACRRTERSWAEQDAYIDAAVDSLGEGELQSEAAAALAELTPREPATDGYERLAPATKIDTGAWTVGFDPATGAINALRDNAAGMEWCRNGHTIGRFSYEVTSQRTCERYLQQYVKNWPRVAWLAPISFVRPDFDAAGVIGDRTWIAEAVDCWHKHDDDAHRFLIRLAMPADAVADFGCPARVSIEWRVPAAGGELDCVVQHFGREASRIPDAMWLTISPKAVVNSGWKFEKVGQEISPFEIVDNGNRRLHAVGDTVRYTGHEGTFEITPLDTPLVAPGRPGLYDFSGKEPEMHHGVAFNLWNNMWNTNFTYWSDDPARFRYRLRIESNAGTVLPDFDDWDREGTPG